MAINLVSQTELSSLFVAEQVTDANGSLQTTAKPTTVVVNVNGVDITFPVDVIAEFQTASGGVLIPRVTQAVRAAMHAVDGTFVFDTTNGAFYFHQGDAWVAFDAAAGGGNVDNPSGAGQDFALAIFKNGLGTIISTNTGTDANNVLLDADGNFTLVNSIEIADGAEAIPSYTFTSDSTTGIYKPGASILGFASNGELNMTVGNAAANVVNYFVVKGAITGASPTINVQGDDADINIWLQANGATGAVSIIPSTNGANAGTLLLENAAGNFYSGFSGDGATVNLVYELPTAAPTVGQILSAAAPVGTACRLSWTAAGTVSVTAPQTTSAIVTFNATANHIQSGALLISAGGIVTQNGVTTAVTQLSNGTAVAPTYTFANSLNCGMYLSAANVIGFSADSTPHLKVGAGLVAVNFLEIIGSITGQPVIVEATGSDTDVDLALYYKGAGAIQVASVNGGGPGVLQLFNTAANQSISLQVAGALASTVAYTLPAAPAVNGEIMSSTSAGVMSWVTTNSVGRYMFAQVAITNGQLLALRTTPIQLIAAIANTAIKVVDMTIELVYGSAALATGGDMFAQYGNAANPANLNSAASGAITAANLFATANTVYNVAGNLPAAGVAAATVKGSGVFLTNLTANFTVGTASTLIVTVGYYLITGLT